LGPIHSDITQIETDNANHKYEAMGEAAGDLMIQELGPVPSQQVRDVKEVTQFVSGLMKGLVGTGEIDQCITDAKTIDTELNTAIADFKKKDIPDIIAGAEVVYQIVQGL
jgi:hypothetical protein